MGHSVGELEVGFVNTNAITLCPNNQFLDGDGSCRTAAQVVSDGGGGSGVTFGNCRDVVSGEWGYVMTICAADEVMKGMKCNSRYDSGCQAYTLRCCKLS